MTANSETDGSFDAIVRRRLRQIRTDLGLTLHDVAERAHLDISTLSRLESGKRRLALDHIPALAAALGVTTDQILENTTDPDPRIRSQPQRLNDGLTKWDLTHRGSGTTRAYKLRVSARRTTPPSTLAVHAGNDWMYVLNGSLRLILGSQDLTIAPGEAVEFDTWTPHWFGAINGPVELLIILGPHGRQHHLHSQEPSLV